MEQNCEKSNGRNKVSKYCIKCKNTFCDNVNTLEVVTDKSGKLDLRTRCPECASESIIYIRSVIKPALA